MLDQLFNIVRQFGQRSVIDNPQVPNQYNQQVMADATGTIANGFQNVLAGGGLGSLLQLFRGRQRSKSGGLGMIGGPLIAMMVGHFISKLVSKYKMNPAAASNVANDLIPQSVNKLVEETRDPGNKRFTLDNLINSLTGRHREETAPQEKFQQLLDKDNDPDDDPEVNELAGEIKTRAQEEIATRPKGTSGWGDFFKGLFK